MISVIIAAYNSEKYIGKCLESLAKQTYRDFEAVVVVDGATDKTLEICESFSLADSRFITVCRENAGPSAARNTARRSTACATTSSGLKTNKEWNLL